ncbi:MAG: polyisoprenoid-binding protein [Kofleriaceae bacterium]|nr:polyisoprenoid-binding protein [Kofleriaceae bacterium]
MTKQTWVFEPGHTGAEFTVRHMMVTNVRGHIKNISGRFVVDAEDPTKLELEATLNANELWSGEADRDAHLKAPDFLDVEKYPHITFKSTSVVLQSENELELTGDLTIRGITKEVCLHVQRLGEWPTPFWEDNEDKGPITRAGFVATTKINRHDFGVSWNSVLDKGGVIVGNMVDISIDVEALLEK